MKPNPEILVKNIIKCAFCDWQIPRWLTNKKGKRVNGYYKLQKHIAFHHWDELEKIIDKLGEEQWMVD